jgi:hypothetical protein
MKTKSFEVVVKLALLLCLLLPGIAGANNIVTSPDEASLRAAIQIGGLVSLRFNGTITITNTIAISNNVILDGSGVAATISGGNVVRVFYVVPGGSLTASNLTLANGSCTVTNGTADAGAIYDDHGAVTLVLCTVTNNKAQSLSDLPYSSIDVSRGGVIFNNGGTVVLDQCGISNNAAIASGVETSLALGGAFYNTNGSISISRCNVSGNLCEMFPQLYSFTVPAAMGGAAFQASGSLAITDSTVFLNSAVGGGGGVIGPSGMPAQGSPAIGGAITINGGILSIVRSQLNANAAKGGNASYRGAAGSATGGAIYSAGMMTIQDSSIAANQSVAGNGTYVPQGGSKGMDAFGGAVYNKGTAMLNRCCIDSNFVQGGSGYAYSWEPANGGDAFGSGVFNASQCAMTNCTVALNSAIGGLGTYPYPPPAAVSGNSLGGGIFNANNAVFIGMNVTVATNSCSSPSARYATNGLATGFQIANTNGTLRLHNSIIAYSGTNANAYGPITDDGYNISSDGTASLSNGSSYNNTDPQLAPLGDYGGPTWCMALLPISPAIDSGDSAGSPNTDQRGFARPFGAGPDIGAYEYGSYLLGIPTGAPGYLNLAASANYFLLSFTVAPSSAYRLQASTNLTTWTDLNTNGPFATATNISQTISRQGFNLRYFRLLLQ